MHIFLTIPYSVFRVYPIFTTPQGFLMIYSLHDLISFIEQAEAYLDYIEQYAKNKKPKKQLSKIKFYQSGIDEAKDLIDRGVYWV